MLCFPFLRGLAGPAIHREDCRREQKLQGPRQLPASYFGGQRERAEQHYKGPADCLLLSTNYHLPLMSSRPFRAPVKQRSKTLAGGSGGGGCSSVEAWSFPRGINLVPGAGLGWCFLVNVSGIVYSPPCALAILG